MSRITTLQQAFVHEISDAYNAEKQLLRALPKLARAATDPTLSAAFTAHIEETQGQIERIDAVVEEMGITLKRIKCQAMEGLVAEAQDVIEEIEKGPVRDAVLVVAAQKAEHYEIATYGCLIAMADALGYPKAADLLRETLAEEKSTDDKLSQLACGELNLKAVEATSQTEAA